VQLGALTRRERRVVRIRAQHIYQIWEIAIACIGKFFRRPSKAYRELRFWHCLTKLVRSVSCATPLTLPSAVPWSRLIPKGGSGLFRSSPGS